MTAGYSGTPLAQKLGLKPGMHSWFQNVPEGVRSEIDRDAPCLDLLDLPEHPIQFAHIFVTSCDMLDRQLRTLLPVLDQAGMIWVSWPKKASKVPTDITEDVIRAIALPLHLVDVKVCAIDQIWSGLKLVIRKEHRS